MHAFGLFLYFLVYMSVCLYVSARPLTKLKNDSDLESGTHTPLYLKMSFSNPCEVCCWKAIFLYLFVFGHNRHSMMPLSSGNFWVSVCEITIISLYLKVWPDGSAVSEFPAILIKSDQAQSSLLSDRELFGLPQLYLLWV